MTGASLALAVGGCAPESASRAVPVGTTPLGGSFQLPYGGVTVSSSQVQNLFGNYAGSSDGLVKKVRTDLTESEVSQAFGFQLSRRDYQGQGYAYIDFSSNGPLGAITHSGYLSVHMAYSFLGTTTFVLRTAPAAVIANLSPYRVSLELELHFTQNGSRFDPTQSSIRILDCELSQGASCEFNSYYDVRLTGELVKR